MVITLPDLTPYRADDVLTCSSDGYPAPTYSWTVNGVDSSTESTQALQEGALEYICTATVTYGGGTMCTDTETATVTTYSKYKTQYNRIVTILMLMALFLGQLAYYNFLIKYYFSNTLIATIMPLGTLSQCCLLCWFCSEVWCTQAINQFIYSCINLKLYNLSNFESQVGCCEKRPRARIW